MADGFAEMIETANGFFAELAANNTKEWYEPRKEFYKAEIKKPAELMADLFAEELSRMTGKTHGSKLFRIHRDVRFSKDKTPYNPHLHLLWSQPGGGAAPVFFFGAAHEYTILGVGIMDLRGDTLTRYRRMIDARGDEIADAIAEAGREIDATVSDWGPPPLKRVPKPYDENHPQAGLLKRKALALTAPLPEGWKVAGVIPTLDEMANHYMPFWRLVQEGMD